MQNEERYKELNIDGDEENIRRIPEESEAYSEYSSSFKDLGGKNAIILGLVVMGFLIFLITLMAGEDCLSEYKRLDCSSLANSHSSDCKVLRTCLASDDHPFYDRLSAFIVTIIGCLTVYFKNYKMHQ